MISTDFIFRQQENLVDNQKCRAGFRPLYNKILFKIHSLHIEIFCLGQIAFGKYYLNLQLA